MIAEKEIENVEKLEETQEVKKKPYKMEIVWPNVLLFAALHAAMIYGFTFPKKTKSLVLGWTIGFMQGLSNAKFAKIYQSFIINSKELCSS